MRSFASDNNAGVHPEILQALNECNKDHVIGYGDDIYTEQAQKLFKELLGEQAEVFFVYGGTGANVVALAAMMHSYNSLICAETAHINVDETGAPEKFVGCKLVDIPSSKGKIFPETIRPYLIGFDFEHHAQPKVISISQPTELGTVYTINELKALRKLANEFNLFLHVDGARISNAAAFLKCSFKEMLTETGVDVVSFGGTKNGLMFGEAVVFLNKDLAHNFKYIRKQGTQLHSKMRFISAQFYKMFSGDLWLRNANHANHMAQVLYQKVSEINGISFTQAVETNALFVILPKDIIPKLQQDFFFYVWDENRGEVRWMTAFDTTEEDINDFVDKIKSYF